MKAVVYRPVTLLGSWRPRSLTDARGLRFPEQYVEIVTMDAESVEHACAQYATQSGDVIVFGASDEREAWVTAPFGWERVKFGREFRSPP